MRTERLLRWLGISLILASGLIHLVNALRELQDPSPFIGLLFIDFFIAAVISAVGIHLQAPFLGWELGGVLSLGALIGYLVSRTIGLPLSGIEKWGPLNAYFSIMLELLFIVLVVRVSMSKLRLREVTS